MKNVKFYLTVSLLALLTLFLSACDGVVPGDLGLDFQTSGQVRGAADTNYNSSAMANSSSSSSSSTDDHLSSRSELKFKGTVDAVTADTITLGGVTFSVATTEDLTTLFTAGSVFEIEYRQSDDGTISIMKFHSEDASSDYDVEFKGMLDGVTADTITLNGETFSVATQEDLTTLFTAGQFYEIKYIFNADDTITIVQFHSEDNFSGSQSVDDNEDYDVEFKGMVEDVTADTITLNGETFSVATEEDLTTLFLAGQFYEIKYIFNDDGTISIVDFHSEDEDDDMNDDSSDDMDDDSSDDSSNNNNDDDNSNNNNNNNNNDNNNDDNSNNGNDDNNNN